MSPRRRKTPSEKKRLAYQRDHVAPAEYPHAFRRQWPRKKARIQRAERRTVRQMLQYVAPKHRAHDRDDMPLTPVRRTPVRKWGVVTLGSWVQFRLYNRIHRTAWNFFKQPYRTEHHRERFIRFLTTIMQGNGTSTRSMAQFFRTMLEGPKPQPPFGKVVVHPHSLWLRAFFRDEPVWEERLRTWVTQHEEK